MPYYFFQWDDEAEQHIADYGITKPEFEEVVMSPDEIRISRSSGRPIAFGPTTTDKYLACIYEWFDDMTVYPITAYEID